MQQHIHSHDAVHWYMGELTSRIVTQSGIPTDRHHLGKIILQGLKDDPDFVLQIDGGTGRSETSGSVLKRSTRCATSFRSMGLKRGDVMVLMAPTHLDLAIPFYAAFYLGITVAPIDKSLGVHELQSVFEVDRPKIIFCQSEKQQDVQHALDQLKLDSKIITFDKGPHGISFSEMLDQYGNDVKDFKKMQQHIHSHDAVHWYMAELTSRIVAQSGIPTDRHHLGKIILQGLKDDPDFVLQIDGGTGRSETSGSVLQRTIRCATSFRSMGLKRGDVMVLMAPTHLDLAIPFYAAFYLGITVAPIDKSLGVHELHSVFEVDRPKIIFCQSEKQQDVQQALDHLKMDSKIITFDKGPHGFCFSEMLDQYGNDVKDFKVADFDPNDTLAMVLSSSGTTGVPKAVAHTHKNFAIIAPYLWSSFKKIPSPVSSVLAMAPLQWLSTILKFLLSPFIRFTRVQSSLTHEPNHIYELINKYRPAFMIISPTRMTTLLKPGEREKCDFTCFEMIMLGGSAAHKSVFAELKKVSPKTEVAAVYGLTEAGGLTFREAYGRPGCLGTRFGAFQYKLVNVDTQEEVIESNVPGELWLKGPSLFKGYYNNARETEETLTKDGWLKTGDLLYRDENWNYYFVERIKLLLKYRGYQVSPVEVESVITQHPDVLDAAVTGIPHEEFGDLPVACVVRRPGSGVSAQEIKDLVKDKLTDSKQLRGGVVFMAELPLTPSTKIHRRKLKEIVVNVERE